MIQLYLIFVKTELTDIIQKGKSIDVRKKSHLFMKELQEHQNKKILQHFLKTTSQKEKQLRILSIIGIMLMKNHNFVEYIGENMQIDTSCTEWLTMNMINPFKQWIKECYQTSEYYISLQEQNNNDFNFIGRGSYLITILKRLVKILKNIPKMGRYLTANKQNDVYQTFSEVLLSLANHLYAILKSSLDKFLSDYRGQNQSINGILKWFFHQLIIEINETLTTVTTCKYFGFYAKGIAASLIRQTEYSKKYRSVLSFLESNEDQKWTKRQKKELQKQFFPEDGSFNADLYMETLETLQQSFYENSMSNRSLCVDKSYRNDSKSEINKMGYENILQYLCQ